MHVSAGAHFALQQGLIGYHSMGREKVVCFCPDRGATAITVHEGRKLLVVMFQKTAAFGNSPKKLLRVWRHSQHNSKALLLLFPVCSSPGISITLKARLRQAPDTLSSPF